MEYVEAKLDGKPIKVVTKIDDDFKDDYVDLDEEDNSEDTLVVDEGDSNE